MWSCSDLVNGHLGQLDSAKWFSVSFGRNKISIFIHNSNKDNITKINGNKDNINKDNGNKDNSKKGNDMKTATTKKSDNSLPGLTKFEAVSWY